MHLFDVSKDVKKASFRFLCTSSVVAKSNNPPGRCLAQSGFKFIQSGSCGLACVLDLLFSLKIQSI